MLADKEAVEYHGGLPVCAVEFDPDALAGVLRRQLKDAPVPAHTGLWILAAERIEALALQVGVILEGQLDGPVVGQIDTAPVRFNERRGTGRHKVPRLLKVPRR